MGILYSKMKEALDSFNFLPYQRDAKILMLGLDGAGKSTVLYQLHLNETVSTIPTIGFNVEPVKHIKTKIPFTVWDVGGQERLRPLWRRNFHDCDGLIYVIDSADTDRIEGAKDELEWILRDDEMHGVPLTVLANKQDLPQAVSSSDIATKLELYRIKDREWQVHGTCAMTGEGLYESVIELSKMVKNRRSKS